MIFLVPCRRFCFNSEMANPKPCYQTRDWIWKTIIEIYKECILVIQTSVWKLNHWMKIAQGKHTMLVLQDLPVFLFQQFSIFWYHDEYQMSFDFRKLLPKTQVKLCVFGELAPVLEINLDRSFILFYTSLQRNHSKSQRQNILVIGNVCDATALLGTCGLDGITDALNKWIQGIYSIERCNSPSFMMKFAWKFLNVIYNQCGACNWCNK